MARRLVKQGRPYPPVPASFARCRIGCGRLVWHFDRGLCGICADWRKRDAEIERLHREQEAA